MILRQNMTLQRVACDNIAVAVKHTNDHDDQPLILQ